MLDLDDPRYEKFFSLLPIILLVIGIIAAVVYMAFYMSEKPHPNTSAILINHCQSLSYSNTHGS